MTFATNSMFGPQFGSKVQQLLEKHTVQEALLIFMKQMVEQTGERNSTERLARVIEDDPPSQPGHSSRLRGVGPERGVGNMASCS